MGQTSNFEAVETPIIQLLGQRPSDSLDAGQQPREPVDTHRLLHDSPDAGQPPRDYLDAGQRPHDYILGCGPAALRLSRLRPAASRDTGQRQ